MALAPLRSRTRTSRGLDRRPPLGRAGLKPAALAAARTQARLTAAVAPPASATAPAEPSTRHTSGHLAGLDGLRAVAVAAVIVFHLHPAWLPGGFLGVDVFFVLSGFLITTLLAREVRSSGRVDLTGFWTRRARRLLPALALCVVVSTLLARAVQSDLLVGIGRQTLGAATFSTNWLEIAAGSDYFHATSPQLFMNFWSLAVEEQFYLLWPLAALVLLRLPSLRARVALPLALGIGSALLMATRLDPNAPTRVYYGTDTHLIGLMLGAALAILYAGPHRAGTLGPRWARLRWPVTAWATVVLLTLFVTSEESSPWAFRIGIPLASIATAVLILSVVSTPSMLRTALDAAPMRWIGQRSYGIYLWHWPVILIVGQLWPVEPGGAGFVASRILCVATTFAIAQASYRFLETPVRRHGFRGVARRVGAWWDRLSLRSVRVVTTAAGVVILAYAVVLATAPTATSTARVLQANAAEAAGVGTGTTVQGATATKAAETAPVTAAEKSTVFAMPSGTEIDAFGDSILVGSIPAMKYYFPGVRLDAKSNRHWSDGLAAIQGRGDDVRRAVIVGFGTNAGIDTASVEAILTELGPRKMVVLVTEYGRFSRVQDDNAALKAIAAKHDNVVVADWYAAVQGTTGQVQPDGIHPSQVGQHLYAKTIRAALAELSTRHTGITPALPDLPLL